MLFSQRPPLDVVMRGYDRRQVEELLERLEAESAAATADRDAALARSADLAAQLANAFAEAESLRRKVRSEASSVVTAENVSDRIRAMLELAEEEAARLREEADQYGAQVRRSVDQDVDRIRAEAQAEAERMTSAAAGRMSEVEAAYQARITEGDSYLAEQRALAASESRASRAALETEIAQASAERERLDAEHLTERERLDADHLARREEADTAAALRRDTATEDFEIALRARRTTEEQKATERRVAADTQAGKTVDDARRHADELITAAHAELSRLRIQRDAAITQLRAASVAIAHTLEVLAPEPTQAAQAGSEESESGSGGQDSAGQQESPASPGLDLSKPGASVPHGHVPSDSEVATALDEGEAADDPGAEGDLDRADDPDRDAAERHSIFAHARDAASDEGGSGESADPAAAAPGSSNGVADSPATDPTRT